MKRSDRRSGQPTRRLLADAGQPPCALETLEKRLALSVDLVVNAGPTSIGPFAARDEVTISVVYANFGDEPVAEQRLEFRLVAQDSEWNEADSVVLGFTDFSVPASSGVLSFTTSVRIPWNVPSGNYLLASKMDAAEQVAETDESNNWSWAGLLQISSGATSDVTLGFEAFTSPVVPSSNGPFRWGESFSLSGSTYVAGTGIITNPIRVQAFIDKDTIFGNADDIASWTGSSGSQLVGGFGWSLNSGALTIPQGTPDGVYSAYFFINGDAAWNEIGFPSVQVPNNRGAVSGGIVVADEDADLTASISAVTPAPASPGQSIVIDFLVTNEYQWRTAGATTARFVLTRDGTVGNSDDITVATQAVPALDGGNSFGGAYTATMPTDIGQGEWRLALIADADNEFAEEDEANNSAIFGDIIYTNSGPDLVVEDLDPNTPQTITVGQTYPLGWILRNAGDADVGASWLEIFISTDTTLGNGDDITVGRFRAPAIATSGSFFATGAQYFSTIPAGTAPGQYYVGVRADADDEHEEADESNNNLLATEEPLLIVRGEPDLVPALLWIEPSNPTPGELTVFTIGASNQGQADAGWSSLLYSLRDATGLRPDIPLGTYSIPPLAAGESWNNDIFVTLPVNIPPGEWQLLLNADADGDVSESNESNNQLTSDPIIRVASIPGGVVSMRGGAALDQTILHQTKATRASGTGFGRVELQFGRKQIVFQITNNADTTLYISSIEPRGQRPEDYQIVDMPDVTIAPGASTTFTLEFNPSAYGTRRANVAIFSGDPNYGGRFTMRVAGRGVPNDTFQDIAVTGGTDTISDGDRKARNGTGQKFGTSDLGDPIDKLYIITNEGNSTLTFLSPIVRVSGTNAGDFTIRTLPAVTTLAPGASTTFTIRFSPLAVGLRKATIEVLTDDPDEGTFDFRVSGLGI